MTQSELEALIRGLSKATKAHVREAIDEATRPLKSRLARLEAAPSLAKRVDEIEDCVRTMVRARSRHD